MNMTYCALTREALESLRELAREDFSASLNPPMASQAIATIADFFLAGCESDIASITADMPLAVRIATRAILSGIERANEAYRDKCEKLAINGKKGGLSKATASKQMPANASNCQQMLANASASSKWGGIEENRIEENRIEKNSTPPSIPQGGSDDANDATFDPSVAFAEFWGSYPRKVSRANAEKAYTKAIKGTKHPAALADKILAALAAHKQLPQWMRDNGQYIPHAATWLHQRRWEDELPLAAPTATAMTPTATVTHSAQIPSATPAPVPQIDLVHASGSQLEDYLRGRLEAAKCHPGQLKNATTELMYHFSAYRDAYARQGWCDDYGHRIQHPDRWLESWLAQELPRAVESASRDVWNNQMLKYTGDDDDL